MAFLDNSGDIILDAVITDEGRRRLSLGDGTFKIGKFALGDDEIDYSQWDGTNASGSAYYDLNILQTPILEAFTNNASSMKSTLTTYTSTNLLYLPVLKLDTATGANAKSLALVSGLNVFVVLVNAGDIDNAANNNANGKYGYSFPAGGSVAGLLAGNIGGELTGPRAKGIMVAQGLDTTDIPFVEALSPQLTETKYLIQMDNRLGSLCSSAGQVRGPAWVDDDNIATYELTSDTAGFFQAYSFKSDVKTQPTVMKGPVNRTPLWLSVFPSDNLRFSDYYFTLFGNTDDTTDDGAGAGKANWTTVYSIDTSIRVIGQTTGYRLDIPIRYVKVITPNS